MIGGFTVYNSKVNEKLDLLANLKNALIAEQPHVAAAAALDSINLLQLVSNGDEVIEKLTT